MSTTTLALISLHSQRRFTLRLSFYAGFRNSLTIGYGMTVRKQALG